MKRGLIGKGLKFILDKNYRFLFLASRGKYDSMDDEEYIKRKYKAIFGTELDLENPKTYNQKIQWLKLYYRRPDYTKYVDKFEVRSYVAKTIGEKHLVPILGVWDSPEDIDFDKQKSFTLNLIFRTKSVNSPRNSRHMRFHTRYRDNWNRIILKKWC